jgi:hypothetical protein
MTRLVVVGVVLTLALGITATLALESWHGRSG